MPEKAIFTKFMSLAGPIIGQHAAQEFMEGVQSLESVKNVRTLFSLLRENL
jgi:hypothetical protein